MSSNRGCLNVSCYVFIVISLLSYRVMVFIAMSLFFVFVWAQALGALGPWCKAPGAHGAHMCQGPGPLGPGAGAPGLKLQDTHGECNYLLSGRAPTVR